jgi:hypothetical protein
MAAPTMDAGETQPEPPIEAVQELRWVAQVIGTIDLSPVDNG